MPAEPPLTVTDRIRRCQRLCAHFVRNLAYFRAAKNEQNVRVTPDTKFWRIANGDHCDIAVLEWCKLFGDPPGRVQGRHGWEYVIGKVMQENPIAFRTSLLASLGLNDDQFEVHRTKFRVYRDKLVAHLDEDRTAYIPHFEVALDAAIFYCEHITAWALAANLQVFGPGLRAEYDACLAEAKAVYAGAQ